MEKEKNFLIELITKFGFPIVCCIALMWYIQDTQLAYREEVKTREDRQYKQIENFSSVLQDFNSTLKSMDARLQRMEEQN